MFDVLEGAAIIAIAVVVAVAGLIFARRLIPLRAREQGTGGAGWIYAALHVMYGVILAFSLFLTWQQFSAAQQATISEASEVEELYRLAGQFPESERGQVQKLAVAYARTVINEEWDLLGRGSNSKPSPRAETLAAELRKSVESLDPKTQEQQVLASEGAETVADFEEARLERVLGSHQGMPSILWAVLVIGGIMTVGFTFFFGIRDVRLHALYVAALTVVIVLVLFAIHRIDYPYTGSVKVQPEAFEVVLQRISNGGGG